MRNIFFAAIIFVLTLCLGCGNDYTPKPRGYFRIDLPEKKYEKIPVGLPYSFEYPAYARIEKRNVTSGDEQYWINISFPEFNARVHLSYKTIHKNIEQYLYDSRGFVYKHTIKADAISETPYIDHTKKVYGIFYEIKGDAASNIQFFVTDSTHNFVRGALYFNDVPNKDSLAPVLDFIKTDLEHLVETFEWQTNGTGN